MFPVSTSLALSSAHPEERLRCPWWEPLEGQRGLFQVPREKEGNPGTRAFAHGLRVESKGIED